MANIYAIKASNGTAYRLNSQNGSYYGTCATAASTAAKTVTLTEGTGFQLTTGAIVTVKFTVTNTAGSPTLNVNSTGAKSIRYRGSAISAGYLAANRVYEFVYDGTDWELIGDIDTNTTYSLSTFGVTATAAELNKLDGVTGTLITSENIGDQSVESARRADYHADYFTGEDINMTIATSDYITEIPSDADIMVYTQDDDGDYIVANQSANSVKVGAATSADKLNTNAGSATQPVYFSNGKPVATTYTLGKSVPSNAVFTDTHYSSKNVVGATNATSNTATALANGNVYINSVENGSVTSSHKISGSGATTVTTDTSGNIIITSTNPSAAGSALGLVKSGGDVTISSGVITVNDDSHSHTYAGSSSAGGAATSADSFNDCFTDENIPMTVDGSTYITDISSNADIMVFTQDDEGNPIVANNSAANVSVGHATTATTLAGLTATAAELNKLDGATVTTSEINKLHGLTATTTELNYLEGATENIQEQIDTLNGFFLNSHAVKYIFSFDSTSLADAWDCWSSEDSPPLYMKIDGVTVDDYGQGNFSFYVDPFALTIPIIIPRRSQTSTITAFGSDFYNKLAFILYDILEIKTSQQEVIFSLDAPIAYEWGEYTGYELDAIRLVRNSNGDYDLWVIDTSSKNSNGTYNTYIQISSLNSAMSILESEGFPLNADKWRCYQI